MPNAILYQAYGGTDFINECRYSLLKYLQVYNLKPPASTGIYIHTDQEHLFSDFLPFFSQAGADFSKKRKSAGMARRPKFRASAENSNDD